MLEVHVLLKQTEAGVIAYPYNINTIKWI